MASQSSYRNRAPSHSFYPSQSPTTPGDSAHIYGSARDMLPPTPLDFLPPRPIEIDLTSSNLNNARTLPSPSASAPAAWGDSALFGSPAFDSQLGSPNIARPHQTAVGSVRTSLQDPLVQWYADNDGPWVPKQIMNTSLDERSNVRHAGNRMPQMYGQQYRSSSQTGGSSFHYPIPTSDSGYGTRQSVGNASVYSGDVNERDQDSQSLLGPNTDYQSYQGYNDPMQIQGNDGRTSDSWATSIPAVSPTTRPPLICPTCLKAVKTPSELKKHDLRHTKPFVCKVPGCKTTHGFSTTNDLERHTKSKHPTAVPASGSKRFRCLVPGCTSKDKSWPRLDNFRSHLKRVHIFSCDEEYEEMTRRGEYMESTGSMIEKDISAEGDKPQAENKPSGQDWQTPQSEEPGTPQGSMLGMDSELEGLALLDLHQVETVKPLEVLTNGTPPTSPSLDAVALNPTDSIDPALTSSAPQKSISIVGKQEITNEASAMDATLVEVVKTALAAVNKAQEASDATRRQNRGRNDLPGGKMATKGSPTDPIPGNVAGSRAAPGDRSGCASDLDLNDAETRKNAQALEVLKIIGKLGFTLQKDHSLPAKAKQSPAVAVAVAQKPDKKADKKTTCIVCKNFTGRPSELKKHMKRHSRPYGCTFVNCHKKFGSKNDWKRHENSQHFHQETLHCDIEKPDGGGPCGKVCYRRQTFQDHLRNQHGMKDEPSIKEKLESCRIGRNCSVRFWCGFCVEKVELKNKGLEAWTERFDHIDDHFMGRNNGGVHRNIGEWVYVNSDTPRGDIDNSEKEPSDGSSSGSSSPEATGTTPANAIVLDPVDKSQSLKRKRSEDDDARPSKSRKVNRICCQCGSLSNPKLEDRCNTCDISHIFCTNCEVQVAPLGGEEDA